MLFTTALPGAYGNPTHEQHQLYIGHGENIVGGVASTGWFACGCHTAVNTGGTHQTYTAWWGPFESEDDARRCVDGYYDGRTPRSTD